MIILIISIEENKWQRTEYKVEIVMVEGIKEKANNKD